MKVARPREGGWPGRRRGEEPCVLLRVGIRPSRAFFTLIGTTPEPHTKSITSGAVGTQCGRAARDQWGSWALGLGAPFERRRTSDFTEGRKQESRREEGGERESGEIRGRFCVFVSRGTGPLHGVQRPPLGSAKVLSSLLLLLLMTGGGGIIVSFTCRLNYLLLVCVVTVRSRGDYSISSPPFVRL